MIDVETELGHIVDGTRIQAIDGIPIPSAPGAKYPGMHLYVNCVYSPEIITLPVPENLDTMRADMVRVLREMVGKAWLRQIRSVCVTFYYWFPERPGAHDPPRMGHLRAYRYSILREGLECTAAEITEQCLLSNRFFQESSELDHIQSVIKQHPLYDPCFWGEAKRHDD